MKVAIIYIILIFLALSHSAFAQYRKAKLFVISTADVFNSTCYPTGKLKNYLPSYSCFGYGLKVSVKRFSVEYNNFESSEFNLLKKDFEYKGLWHKETPTKYTSYEFILGFSPYQGDLFQLSILAGCYFPKIVPSENYIVKHQDYKNMSISSGPLPKLGLNYDYYLTFENYRVRRNKKNTYYIHFRASALYQLTSYSSTSSELKGGFVCLQFAGGLSWKAIVSKRRR